MIRIQFQPPRIPANGVSNLVGLLGLIAVVAAVGGLTHNWWWSVLAAGVVAVALSVLAQKEQQAAAGTVSADAPTQELRAVKTA